MIPRTPGNPRFSARRPVPLRVWRHVLPPRQEETPAVNQAALSTGAPARLHPKPAKPSGTTGTARTRQLAAVEPQQPWLVRVVAGAWLGIAHVVGAGIRRIGHDVSDLAPEDRRDGAALFNLALGVFVATFAWWGFQGWLPGHGLWNRQRHLRLDGACCCRSCCSSCAFRLFRQPDDGRGNNRIGIGFLIMTFAGSGLAHVIGGQPTVADGFDGLRRAGGMLGYLAAAPLAAIHSAVPAGRLRPARLYVAC